MSDIIERLNSAGDLAIPGEPRRLFYDAANEIERLRLTAAEREAVERAADLIDAKTCGDSSTLRSLLSRTGSDDAKTGDDEAECHANGEKNPERDRRPLGDPEIAVEILRLRVAELEEAIRPQHTLTDAERWALKYFAAFDRSPRERDAAAAATLRGLLERLGGGK